MSIDNERPDTLVDHLEEIPGDFGTKKSNWLPLKLSNLPDWMIQMQNEIISAHPEIFKVKMLAKKNVKTISTMSSSNYDNSDNSSSIGGKGFKVPKKRFYDREIMTEWADNKHTQEIDTNLAEILGQQNVQNRSKDDEWMDANSNSEEAMNEYLRLIRDSPFLLKRSFLYNREIDQMKIKEKEMLYELSLQNVKLLFGEDQENSDEKEAQNNEWAFHFSPMKDLNEPLCDDVLSVSSDCKHYPAYNDHLEYDDNSSIRDDPINAYSASQWDNRSYISHSSYTEDMDVEMKDFSHKGAFKTPRKWQRLSGYGKSSLNWLLRQDSDTCRNDKVRI